MKVSMLLVNPEGLTLEQVILPLPPAGQTLTWSPMFGAALVRQVTIFAEEDESVVARLERKVSALQSQLDQAAAILRGEQPEYDPFDWEEELL